MPVKNTRFIGKLGKPKRFHAEQTAKIDELDTANEQEKDRHVNGIENEYAQKYISHRRNSKSENTVSSDIDSLKKWEKYILHEAGTVENIRYINVHNLGSRLAAEGYTVRSIDHNFSGIRMFHRWMNDLFSYNLPTFTQLKGEEFTRNNTTRLKKSVTKDQIRKMVDTANNGRNGTRDTLIILLFSYTGLRLRELADLRLSNVDIEGRTIVFTRSKKGNYQDQTGTIRIHEDLNWLLEIWISVDRKQLRYGSESDYLFLSENSENISPDRIYGIVHTAARDAGVIEPIGRTADGKIRWNISPHSFRHSFSDMCRKQGLSREEIASLLGHENVSTTNEYGDLDDIPDAIKSYDKKFGGIGK